MDFVFNKRLPYVHKVFGMEILVFLLLQDNVLMIIILMEVIVLKYLVHNVLEVQLCKEEHV
jgi:hypothetical protein